MEGQHYWSTGAKGNEADLAGLVCDNLSSDKAPNCINSMRGENHDGDTWERRRGFIDGLTKEIERLKDG